jgi:outer membrane protein insertion porin family
VRVEERPLGAVSLGIGFSSTENFLIQASLTQQNFMGTGTDLAVQINSSTLQRTFSISHVDPYWSDDGVSRSIDVYTRRFYPSVLFSGNNYSITSQGLGARFGIPYTELDRIFLGTAVEQNRYELNGPAPSTIERDIESFGSNPTAYLLTFGWSRDSRNSALAPTQGQRQFVNLDYATPFGEVEYLRATLGYQSFLPITRTFTYAVNAEVGIGEGLNGKRFPSFKNFYAGGIGSVRGFQAGGIGPLIDGRSLGGNTRLILNNELLFPLPGMAQDRTVRLFTFLDIGSVWTQADRPEVGDLRAALGFGLSWLSPVGPLKLSVGNAVKKETFDRTQRVQFNIGTGF